MINLKKVFDKIKGIINNREDNEINMELERHQSFKNPMLVFYDGEEDYLGDIIRSYSEESDRGQCLGKSWNGRFYENCIESGGVKRFKIGELDRAISDTYKKIKEEE